MSEQVLPKHLPLQQDKPSSKSKPKKAPGRGSDPLSLTIMKSLQRKSNSETESSNGGNNSDNSALVSLGNHSFGFNFDSEEGNSNPASSDRNESDDSDGNGPPQSKPPATSTTSSDSGNGSKKSLAGPQHSRHSPKVMTVSSTSSFTASSSNESGTTTNISSMNSDAHRRAAASAVANLQSIAKSFPKSDDNLMAQRKRKSTSDADSGGYNTDNEEEDVQRSEASGFDPSQVASSGMSACRSMDSDSNDGTMQSGQGGGRKKKKKLGEDKREERNAREKERSFRITRQINEIRELLSNGGVIVPKGTKSSVLVEAANYIRMLQQHQYRSEIDRHQLVQQMQLIGGGAHGPQAATAVRHVAAQNGVWSLGNFGGVPPKSAMTTPFYQPNQAEATAPAPQEDAMRPNKIDTHEYRFVFNSCGVGMAIASMGGAFIDCNQLFCQLSEYSKQEVCGLTIFNLTARQDLQQAFDMISQMISPPMEKGTPDLAEPIVLRGAMKTRDDLGLSVSLIKGEDGVSKCFCVTLVKNPASPFDTSKPAPVSFESVKRQPDAVASGEKNDPESLHSAPAFTSG